MPLNINPKKKEVKEKVVYRGHRLVDDYLFSCNYWVTKDGVVTGEPYSSSRNMIYSDGIYRE